MFETVREQMEAIAPPGAEVDFGGYWGTPRIIVEELVVFLDQFTASISFGDHTSCWRLGVNSEGTVWANVYGFLYTKESLPYLLERAIETGAVGVAHKCYSIPCPSTGHKWFEPGFGPPKGLPPYHQARREPAKYSPMLVKAGYTYDGEPVRQRLIELGIMPDGSSIGDSNLRIPAELASEFSYSPGSLTRAGHLGFRGLRMEGMPLSVKATFGAIALIVAEETRYAYYRVDKMSAAPVEEWLTRQ